MKAVIGLGLTGMACVDYLLAQGETVCALDTRADLALTLSHPNLQVHLGSFRRDWLAAADEIIISPGVDPRQAAFKKHQAKIIGDIELFLRATDVPIIAVTGSNGKSTIVTLLQQMAQAAGISSILAGNVGVPVLECLKQTQPEFYILELSSFQLDSTHSLRAKVACISNITADHLDRYANFADYQASKQRIYQGAQVAIYNRADVVTMPHVSTQQVSFALDKPIFAHDWGIIDDYLARGQDKLIAIAHIKQSLPHQLENALASCALAEQIGIPSGAMQQVLAEFSGLDHRFQLVKEADGIKWINDSKATNVGASIAAINSARQLATGKIILIAGGDNKGIDLSELNEVLQTTDCVLAIGKAKQHLQQVIKNAEVQLFDDLQQVVQQAKKIAQKGDVVLLAPACASIDMFANYQERGELFSELALGFV